MFNFVLPTSLRLYVIVKLGNRIGNQFKYRVMTSSVTADNRCKNSKALFETDSNEGMVPVFFCILYLRSSRKEIYASEFR